MIEAFERALTIISLVGKNALEVILTEECSRRPPFFPVSLVKPYHNTGEDRFPSRNNTQLQQEIVEVVAFPGPAKKITNSRKIGLNGKYHRQ
ncbi:hypothetical protein O181_048867 [Austropuccinia psidii MF-1]|uniref:Uncharacterized protein n=1 Tax=Austropuccinia psidii MF-1 TaxID=1389203 RepID=A0A9Q3DVW1_9BASI|nr:hypothetical protein [Austropuccinia psidii MF-1]